MGETTSRWDLCVGFVPCLNGFGLGLFGFFNGKIRSSSHPWPLQMDSSVCQCALWVCSGFQCHLHPFTYFPGLDIGLTRARQDASGGGVQQTVGKLP